MKLSKFKRIIAEDFAKEYFDLVNRLGYSINGAMQEFFNITNKNLTIEDNLFQEIKTITITMSSTSMVPSELTQFRNGLRTPIKGISVIAANNLTNTSSYPTGAVQMFFSENNNIVTINRISGLEINNKYRFNIITYGG